MTLVDELRGTFLFEHLDDEQLDWLAERVTEERYPKGSVLFHEGDPAAAVWVLLEGQIQLTRRITGEDVVLITSEQHGAYAGAIRAFVRAAQEEDYGTTGHLLRDSWLIRIPSEVFTELLETYFPIAQHLLDGLFLGVRSAEALYRQHEKLAALGSLSAGLAHELNNPAAAGRRAAGELRHTIEGLQGVLAQLGEADLPPDALARLADLPAQAVDGSRSVAQLDSIASSDAEDELTEWLDEREVEDGWRLASALVDAGIEVTFLERLEDAVGQDAFAPALVWITNVLTATALVDNVREATERVSRLVAAVKDYTNMDRAPVSDVDLHDGIESTLTMLGHKLRDGVTVERDYDRSLPRVRANSGELNQVWTNLIDNALGAVGDPGTVRISTARDSESLLVEIGNDGPGIPEAVRARVFEPFFTTKDVGKGTGLGLDISRRIVERHGGSLTFTSQPGDTRFRVRIPLG